MRSSWVESLKASSGRQSYDIRWVAACCVSWKLKVKTDEKNSILQECLDRLMLRSYASGWKVFKMFMCVIMSYWTAVKYESIEKIPHPAHNYHLNICFFPQWTGCCRHTWCEHSVTLKLTLCDPVCWPADSLFPHCFKDNPSELISNSTITGLLKPDLKMFSVKRNNKPADVLEILTKRSSYSSVLQTVLVT